LVYAAPRDDLEVLRADMTGAMARLEITNLTEHCEYRVGRSTNLLGSWRTIDGFTAAAAETNWSDTEPVRKVFYRVLGLPQAEP
jgi:hypothetical protein